MNTTVRDSKRSLLFSLLVASVALVSPFENACAESVYGPELQGFEYPYELNSYFFESQGTHLKMGYMDTPASGKPNGRTVVLMHGKNFCGATWGDSIRVLSQAGYRVVTPDQIGFCSSTKPEKYQYSFQQLATNTHALLEKLKVGNAVIIGHSTGGMLATRYALMFADQVEGLVLVNPIGLEDWKSLGVPYRTVDQWYQRELTLTADSVRAYEAKTYYVGRWQAQYERWVDMLAGLNRGPGQRLVAWNSALLYDMIFTQPVVYEFKDLKAPTLLIVGDADTTAIGSDLASKEVREKIGRYAILGKQISAVIQKSTLVEFAGLGHAPQMEDPDKFHDALLKWLAR